MRLISFPGSGAPGPREEWLAELEAALDGVGQGPEAEYWRDVREDVRALAEPLDPEFERELFARITARSHEPSRGARARLHGILAARSPILGAVAALAAVAVAVVLAAPWRSPHGAQRPAGTPRGVATTTSSTPPLQSAQAETATPAPGVRTAGSSAGAPAGTGSSAGAAAGAAGQAGPASGASGSFSGASGGRVQQVGAAVVLSAAPSEVQPTSDAVAQVAVRSGGWVQSSHVQSEQSGGEAQLMLVIPSAKLEAALAAIGRIAPVKSETRSLADITGEYSAAQSRVADLQAERRALLRALAAASSEGQIASLRERLASNRSAIGQAEGSLQSIQHRAATAEVEVTVTGDRAASGGGPSVHRGLHDAERVLVVVFDVLLIALAVLVPLGLLAAVVLLALRTLRRARRERALGAG